MDVPDVLGISVCLLGTFKGTYGISRNHQDHGYVAQGLMANNSHGSIAICQRKRFLIMVEGLGKI
jgi:hypothetical protein